MCGCSIACTTASASIPTARVVRVWERRGHKFVTLDVVITAGEPAAERVVMQAEHTAIYEPRSREPD